jgi:hypothetical protein
VLIALLAILAAIGLAALTYFRAERLERPARAPFLLRAIAGSALALLLVNPTCAGRRAAARPLVLLDGSLSMAQRPEAWRAARARADSLGEVRLFGDEGRRDTLPTRGRSRLGPALAAAAALDRPLVVITDGELDDASDLPSDLLRRATVELRPRTPAADVALIRVTAPPRLTVGDTLRVEVQVLVEGIAPESVVVELRDGPDGRRLARRALRVVGGTAGGTLRAPTGDLAPGEHLVAARVSGVGDQEPRTDERLAVVRLARTPGIVLVADPGDWDARFLHGTIKDVGQVPLRGYVRLGDRWSRMGDLRPATAEEVRRAVQGADLLVVKGAAVSLPGSATARATWSWPSGASGPVEPGDWYLAAAPTSPVSVALAGLPVDSFAPVTHLTATTLPANAWVALTAQAGRRGAPRPAHFGAEQGGRRRVVTAVDGLWRWRFRGGGAEQAYRGLVAATVAWLLDSRDSTTGLARPVRPVVEQGHPVVFEWTGPGVPAPVPVAWSGAASGADTLRFDGSGRASLDLAPGAYRVRLAGGPEFLVGVEVYSREWLARPVALAERAGEPVGSREQRGARGAPWLLGIAVLALCGEWLLRRRLGLR